MVAHISFDIRGSFAISFIFHFVSLLIIIYLILLLYKVYFFLLSSYCFDYIWTLFTGQTCRLLLFPSRFSFIVTFTSQHLLPGLQNSQPLSRRTSIINSQQHYRAQQSIIFRLFSDIYWLLLSPLLSFSLLFITAEMDWGSTAVCTCHFI